jgi:uncharacterized membrane protein
MSRKTARNLPAHRPENNSPANSGAKNAPADGMQLQHVRQFYGPTPAPEDLERYERLVPGVAVRLFALAEEESRHRMALEDKAGEANIQAQQRQLAVAEYQSRAVFRSDLLGQIGGVIVSISCIYGAVYLGINSREIAASALTMIPLAAVVRALSKKKP